MSSMTDDVIRSRPVTWRVPRALVTLLCATLAVGLAGCLPSDSGFDDSVDATTTTPVATAPAAGPGLSITSAQVPLNGHPVVEFTLLDETGAPITDLSSASFTFAKLAPRSRYGNGYDWVNYITRERQVNPTGWTHAVSEDNPDGAPIFGNAIQGNVENSSGTPEAPIPTRSLIVWAGSSRLMGARCSWTKSGICPWPFKPSCCVFWRTGSSIVWATPNPALLMCAPC